MDKQTALEIVMPLYTQAFTVNATTTPNAVMGRVLADGFRSVNGQGSKDRATLIGQVESFWKLIPDLKWEPKDFVVEGNKMVVRSVASGTPKGNFMGTPCDGTRSFTIDTIDIHEIEDARVARVYHVEDWATALRQLEGR
jgi:predicted ester cyclase